MKNRMEKPVRMWIENLRLFLPLLLCLSSCSTVKPFERWGDSAYFVSPVDGTCLHIQVRFPAQKPKGLVVLVHGLGEHSGHFKFLVEALSPEYACVGLDLRGHGLSNRIHRLNDSRAREGKRRPSYAAAYTELLPYSNLKPFAGDLLAAIREATKRYRTQVGDGPEMTTVIAHSLGCQVVLRAATDNPEFNTIVDACVFSGPAFSQPKLPGLWGIATTPFIASQAWSIKTLNEVPENPKLIPLVPLAVPAALAAYLTMEIASLPLIHYVTTPQIGKWIVPYISDDPEEGKSCWQDPYRTKKQPTRWLGGIGREIARTEKRFQAFSLPCLVIYAPCDPIASPQYLKALISSRKEDALLELLELAGANHHYHFLSSKTVRDRIFTNIKLFLSDLVKGT